MNNRKITRPADERLMRIALAAAIWGVTLFPEAVSARTLKAAPLSFGSKANTPVSQLLKDLRFGMTSKKSSTEGHSEDRSQYRATRGSASVTNHAPQGVKRGGIAGQTGPDGKDGVCLSVLPKALKDHALPAVVRLW